MCWIWFWRVLANSILYFLFILLRKYSGGYHAETSLECNTISYSLFVATLILSSVKRNEVLLIIGLTGAFYLIWTGSSYSVNHKKYSLKNIHTKYLRLVVFALMIVMIFLYRFLFFSSSSINILACVLAQVACLNFINDINRKEID